MSYRRQQVANAFARAADYDRHATVQRRVAERLARQIAQLPLHEHPRVLEIGCGTGFLTRALLTRGVLGKLLATDIAPPMVERCRAQLDGRADIDFAQLDGENPAALRNQSFDIICSSLALQWFEDLEAGIARLIGLLAPGGHLIFTTLAANTFAEWRDAHAGLGLVPGTPRYPTSAQLAAMRPLGLKGQLRVCHYGQHYAKARDFLAALKSIGAGIPAADHRPLRPGELRRVMHKFERNGGRATYEVVTCHFTRSLDA